MALKNKTICNSITGQEITFLQTARDTAGQLLEMESGFRPYSGEPPPHYHPTAMGLANDSKTREDIVPNILQVALMADRFAGVFRLAKPSFLIQRIVFATLTPIAYLLGYRPIYKKYID